MTDGCAQVDRGVVVINLHPRPEKRHCGEQVSDFVSHTVSTSHESVTQIHLVY